MDNIVTYSRSGPISKIVMDDGKVNVLSERMLEALHAAFDEAERDKTVVVLTGRGATFSAGFDLKVFAGGGASDLYRMLKAGSELALRILSFPTPVVIACNGNTVAMGAFLALSADLRIAAEGDYKIGLNEVAIGIAIPRFGVELARQRLTPAYFSRAVITGEMFSPPEAVTAGFLDRVVPTANLDTAADQAAETLSKINMSAHAATKLLARGQSITAIRAAIDTETTLEYAERFITSRSASA
ncbi:MAG TPA: crotonase/enoyl-CoA hydratase family protein [Ktedonobacterales bacterium]|nr:crotonase/enoyl-CoA hydratase family protein [Ktedonobacterales bacterium]